MATETMDRQNGSKADALTLERAKQLFSPEAFREGGDLTLIKTYYHPEVRFRDAIQEVHGRDEFLAMTERFLKRAKGLTVEVRSAAQTGQTIFLEWTMALSMGGGPRMTIEGSTRLTLDAQGKVVDHRDYFDLWGDTLSALPGVGKAYRAIMKKFG